MFLRRHWFLATENARAGSRHWHELASLFHTAGAVQLHAVAPAAGAVAPGAQRSHGACPRAPKKPGAQTHAPAVAFDPLGHEVTHVPWLHRADTQSSPLAHGCPGSPRHAPPASAWPGGHALRVEEEDGCTWGGRGWAVDVAGACFGALAAPRAKSRAPQSHACTHHVLLACQTEPTGRVHTQPLEPKPTAWAPTVHAVQGGVPDAALKKSGLPAVGRGVEGGGEGRGGHVRGSRQ